MASSFHLPNLLKVIAFGIIFKRCANERTSNQDYNNMSYLMFRNSENILSCE